MDTENSQQNVRLVTGGAGGIGLAVCRALAKDGHVVVVDMDGGRAATAAETLTSEGLPASHAACDVSDAASVTALRETLLEQGRTASVLANLAGVVRNATLSKVTDDDFMLTLRSHLVGTLNMMRAFAPDMKKASYGRIVNCSSIASNGSIAGSAYSAAKAGIEGLSRTVAIELAPFGITVNVIAPGIVDTGMFKSTPQEYQEKLLSRTPMRRVASPDEIASCVRFFASPECSFVTGQTLFACGGLTIGALG